jgi:hypothetical protein
MGMTTKLSGAENDRLHSTASRTTREMYDGGGGESKPRCSYYTVVVWSDYS